MTKAIPGARLTREVEVEIVRAADDDQPPTFRAALSSEAPYPRWFGTEILDHAEASIDLARAGSGLPLLWGHNTDEVIGRVENLKIESRKLRGDLKFFPTERGNEVRTMIEHGHREVSVGYTIERMRLEKQDGDEKTYRAVRWNLLEASVVGVPADATVGVGRSADSDAREMPPVEPDANTETLERAAEMPAAESTSEGVISMSETTQAPAKSSVADIIALGERYAHLGGDKVAQGYLRSGRADMAEFQAELLDKVGTKASETAAPTVGLTDRERRQFSVVRLIHALANPTDRGAQERAAFEMEASEAAQRTEGRSRRGGAQATIPTDVLQYLARDLLVGTTSSGGFTVGTDMLGGSFVDVLRNKAFTMQAGATVLSGLQGAIAIPTKATGALSYWVAEGTAPTEGAIVFGQIAMSPKTLGAYVDFSRKMLLQSSLDVEAMVRNDLASSLAVGIDSAALSGNGTAPTPAGILSSTSIGISTAGANGGAPTWALMVALETAVADGNADRGALAYFVNSKTRGKLKTVAKSTAVTDFIWESNNTVNGYNTFVTNQLTAVGTKGTSSGICSAAIFGNWNDLMIGMWGGLDLLVDPYTASNAGTVRVVALQDVDVAIRRAASFAKIEDLLTT